MFATNVDSLLQTVKMEQEDTNTVNTLIEITRLLRSNYPDSAQIYAEKALVISEKNAFEKSVNKATYQLAVIFYYKGNNDKALDYIKMNKAGLIAVNAPKRELVSTLIIEGNVYKNIGDYSKAISIYNECLEIAKEGNHNHIWVVVKNNKSNIYRRQGKYVEALKIYFEALKVCDREGLESDKVMVLSNIGLVYKEQKDYDKALSYFQQVLKYHQKNKNKRRTATLLNNIGNIYTDQAQFSKALKAHQKALEIRQELGNLSGEASSLLNIGELYLKAFSDYEQAMIYAKRSLEKNQSANLNEGTANAYLTIAEIYEYQNEPTKAIQNAENALEILKDVEDLVLHKEAYEILAKNYEFLGNYKKSLNYYKEEQIVSDSIFSQSNRDAINEITQKYKFEQQEQTILTQQLQLEKQEALLDREVANRLLLIGVIVFLLALGVLGFFFTRQKQEANKKLQQLNNEVNSQNEELLMAQSRLKVANQDLQSFAQMASHDLKEPLRMMSSFASLLKRRNKNLGESSQEYIGFITDAATRMTRMIDDMLSYATNNIQVENMEYLNMNDLIQTIQQNLYVAIMENNAIVNVGNNLPQIKGQSSLIEQVFQNLVSNAIKFRKPNVTPIIDISAKIVDNKIIYTVSDNGIGIASENQANVFQLFKRFNKEYEGSGIGLTTCKKIVELHQGTIELTSTVGEGTTFTLTFSK
ncbi:MAG: tetratricopeptide repeat protein [Saprospiraceae bacterium]